MIINNISNELIFNIFIFLKIYFKKLTYNSNNEIYFFYDSA